MQDWYARRRSEPATSKNINTMSVLYSISNLIELDEKRPINVFNTETRQTYLKMLEEWAEWVMNDLPRVCIDTLGTDSRHGDGWISAQ